MNNKRIPFLKMLRIILTIAGIIIMIIAMTTVTRVPLHQRVLVQGIGIDQGETEPFKVTVQAISTSSNTSVEVYQAEGSSVYDALNNITLVSGKSPFYTHNSVIIVGKACAQQGLYDIMDFFVRHNQTRPAENMFLADNKAEEILTLKSDMQISVDNNQLQTNQYVMASQIAQLASAGDLDSQLLEAPVLTVASALYSQTSDVYLPILTVKDKEISVNGCGIFNEDKLSATLDTEQTAGMKAINNTVVGGAIELKLDNGDSVTLSFANSDCEIETEIRDNIPHFTITLTCGMNIDEITRPLQQTLSRSDFAEIGEAASQRIQSVVQDTVETTIKQHQSDVLGFSTALLKQQTAWWKQNEDNWSNLMKECTYTVTVTAHIEEQGQEMSPQTIDPF